MTKILVTAKDLKMDHNNSRVTAEKLLVSWTGLIHSFKVQLRLKFIEM